MRLLARLGTGGLATIIIVGAIFRLWRIYHSHASLPVTVVTTALVVGAVAFAIARARAGEKARIWPPTRTSLAAVIVATIIALLVDVPGYFSAAASLAENRILARHAAHDFDSFKDTRDGVYVALGDNPWGFFTSYERLPDDIESASTAAAPLCANALARIDADKEGFADAALATFSVDESVARAHCAYVSGDLTGAQLWIRDAARRDMLYSTSSAIFMLNRLAYYARDAGDYSDASAWETAYEHQLDARLRKISTCHDDCQHFSGERLTATPTPR